MNYFEISKSYCLFCYLEHHCQDTGCNS